ncbi:MAG TPA: oligoendopeptidase F [Chloroflexota bacterium]|nr:oligoendopeptidase F [Chloroflexota bacterium]
MPAAALPTRSEIALEFTWDLESIYPRAEAWEADFRALEARLPELSAFEGRLGTSATELAAGLKLQDELGVTLGKLYSYSHMKRDEDTTQSSAQGMHDRMVGLYARFSAAGAFFTPEIVALEPSTVERWLSQEPQLAVYRFLLESTLRQRGHTRSAEVEGLLAQSMEVGQGASTVYDMLTDADLKFPRIKDGEGNDVELTHGRYIPFQQSPDRRVRKDSFEALYTTYAAYKNTVAAAYSTSVKGDIFYARAHNYESAQQAALDGENIPLTVYSNLVERVESRLDLMQRYLRLRKRVLELDDLHMYDVYADLIPSAKKEIPFPRARQDVLAAVSVLGDDYQHDVAHGFSSRWVDVYETPGKASGAYSSGSYGTHPFILMNFQDNLDGVYTLAHELGHSMHSFYTRATQPPVYSDYSLFVAEVASITNEALLTNYLLQQDMDVDTRKALLNNELEKYRGTLFRQTMFAHFEAETHRLAEAGEALTSDMLNKLYYDLVARYFAPETVVDELIAYEWSRIPHFYRAFYVYQYATGIAAATALAKRMLEEGEPAVRRYRAFLAAGGSDYPINLLRSAGVDMTSPAPVQAALDHFGRLLDELEELV